MCVSKQNTIFFIEGGRGQKICDIFFSENTVRSSHLLRYFFIFTIKLYFRRNCVWLFVDQTHLGYHLKTIGRFVL